MDKCTLKSKLYGDTETVVDTIPEYKRKIITITSNYLYNLFTFWRNIIVTIIATKQFLLYNESSVFEYR